jgi:hypothetical protein
MISAHVRVLSLNCCHGLIEVSSPSVVVSTNVVACLLLVPSTLSDSRTDCLTVDS